MQTKLHTSKDKLHRSRWTTNLHNGHNLRNVDLETPNRARPINFNMHDMTSSEYSPPPSTLDKTDD